MKFRSDAEEEKKTAQEGNTVIYLVKNTKVIATLGLRDTCRKESKKVISALQEKGMNIILLTGDNETVSKKIAKELDITNIYTGLNPLEKKEFIQKLIKNGHEVLMIGDGINDAPSLAVSTMGIALKGASDIPTSSADILLNINLFLSIMQAFVTTFPGPLTF